jgi:hypothetical protein
MCLHGHPSPCPRRVIAHTYAFSPPTVQGPMMARPYRGAPLRPLPQGRPAAAGILGAQSPPKRMRIGASGRPWNRDRWSVAGYQVGKLGHFSRFGRATVQPPFRPRAGAFGRAAAWGGADDGGREELAEVCPSRAPSSRIRSCRALFSTRRAAFSAHRAAFSRRSVANSSRRGAGSGGRVVAGSSGARGSSIMLMPRL